MQIHPVILCGGSGTRLWPRSRATLPKPFLSLVNQQTLFEATLERCSGPEFSSPLIVTGEAHLAHVKGQCGEREISVIVEPAGRNTAPAIALAAARLPKDAVMLVVPSDHHIVDRKAFSGAALSAAALAQEGMLVAFGIKATAPETGFGYIRRGDPLALGGYHIAEFVEKPDRVRAETFLADGGYSWNGGIFCFTAARYLAELELHRPAMAKAVLNAVAGGFEEGDCFYPDAVVFQAVESNSIDYAVMERTDHAAMVPVSMGWSDIGNWPALYEARNQEADADGNVKRGRTELTDCRGVMVETDGPRVSVVGLEDVIVIVDGDEVLVTSHIGAQKVGKLGGAINQ